MQIVPTTREGFVYPFNLDNLKPNDVVRFATRLVKENAEKKAAARIEDALQVLRCADPGVPLSPRARDALRTLADSRPTSWLEFAVKLRLAEEGLR